MDAFVEGHAGGAASWAAAGVEPAPEGRNHGGRASFLLLLGLRAVSAGNFAAAERWLSACERELVERVQATGSTEKEKDRDGGLKAKGRLRCELGAALGCLGDCRRGAGDAVGALMRYEESAEQLRRALEDGADADEVRRAEAAFFLPSFDDDCIASLFSLYMILYMITRRLPPIE